MMHQQHAVLLNDRTFRFRCLVADTVAFRLCADAEGFATVSAWIRARIHEAVMRSPANEGGHLASPQRIAAVLSELDPLEQRVLIDGPRKPQDLAAVPSAAT